MGFIGIFGFESQSIQRDGFTQQSGNSLYTADVPAGGSTRSWNGSTGDSVIRAPFSASASEFWYHIKVKPRSNTNDNDNTKIGWAANTGLRGEIRFQDFTMLPQIFVNGALEATASSAPSLNAWKIYHVHVVVSVGAGSVNLYEDGDLQTPIATFLGNTDPFADGSMDEFYLRSSPVGNSPWYYDDILIMDPNDGTGVVDPNEMLNCGLQPKYPTSDGTHVAWTGTGAPGGANDFNFIDEAAPSDGDYIRASAAAQKSTFGFDDVPSGVVLGARLKARTLRGDATAGSNIRTISRQGGVDYVGATQPCPAAGDVDEIYNLAPDSTAWDTTKFNAVEWGVESVT